MTLAARMDEEVAFPKGVKVSASDGEVTVQGPQGTLTRAFRHPRVTVEVRGDSVHLSTERPSKREKAMMGTFAAHLRNMARGVTQGFEYRMKIVYSHFPMRASVKEDRVVIENFLGERYPRFASIVGKTGVAVKGDIIVLTGADREDVGQTAANIERATKIKGYDPRIFQDGIYITSKGEG